MPIPVLITDLSQTAGSNYPQGTDSPSTIDDVQRAHGSFIARLRDGAGFTNSVTLASASTTDIGAQTSLCVEISGVTTITSFGTNYNGPRFVRFTNSLTLTHNATTLNLPGDANVITAAGDTAIVTPNITLNGWNVVSYTRSNGSSSTGAAYAIENFTATAGQTLFTLTSSYAPSTNTLQVYVNGLLVNRTTDYTETSSTSVTFTSGLTVGDEVVFQIWRSNILTSGDAVNISYTPAGTGAVATTVQAKLRESVSVKDFGAVGDGVTDDTAALITAIAASNGRTLVCPAGTYRLASQIAMAACHDLVIQGEGTGTQFLLDSTYTGDFFYVTSGVGAFANIAIDGIYFNSNSTIGTGASVIRFDSGNEVSLSNCIVNRGQVRFTNQTNLRVLDNQVYDWGSNRSGIITAGSNLVIDKNYCAIRTDNSSDDGIVVSGPSNGVIVSNNVIDKYGAVSTGYCRNGINLNNVSGGLPIGLLQNVLITGNTIQNFNTIIANTEAAITISGATTDAEPTNTKDISIIGNTFISVRRGIDFSAIMRNVIVSDNTLKNIYSIAINTPTGTGYSQRYLDIHDNTIYNDTTFNAGAKMTMGILLKDFLYANIHHNTIRNATAAVSMTATYFASVNFNFFKDNTTCLSLTNHKTDSIAFNSFQDSTTGIDFPSQGFYYATNCPGNTFNTVTTSFSGASLATTSLLNRTVNNFATLINGAKFAAADIALAAGWGTTATVSQINGTDTGFNLRVAANGTGITANPTVTVTFHVGAWAAAPVALPNPWLNIGTGVTFPHLSPTVTTATLTLQFFGTPVTGNTYETAVLLMGM